MKTNTLGTKGGTRYIVEARDHTGKLIGFAEGHNIMPTEGLNHAAANGMKSTQLYIGLFKGNVTPVAGDTAAAKLGAAGTYQMLQDVTDYSGSTEGGVAVTAGNYPKSGFGSVAGGVCDNYSTLAEFTIVGALTIYGATLQTAVLASANTGSLVAAMRFSAAMTFPAGGGTLAVKMRYTQTSA